MSYRWQAAAGSAAPVPVGSDFPDQAAAEAWLGEYYLDLVEDGHEQVWLYEADRLVYGPMSLSE